MQPELSQIDAVELSVEEVRAAISSLDTDLGRVAEVAKARAASLEGQEDVAAELYTWRSVAFCRDHLAEDGFFGPLDCRSTLFHTRSQLNSAADTLVAATKKNGADQVALAQVEQAVETLRDCATRAGVLSERLPRHDQLQQRAAAAEAVMKERGYSLDGLDNAN